MEDEKVKKNDYKERDSFFNQVVREAVRQLRSEKSAYCFSMEQVRAILEEVEDAKYRIVDGIYYLSKGE